MIFFTILLQLLCLETSKHFFPKIILTYFETRPFGKDPKNWRSTPPFLSKYEYIFFLYNQMQV